MKSAVKTLFFFSMGIAYSAHAAIYMCKDSSGRTLTSDRPIPECADRMVREFDRNGMLKKEIPAPLTAEQKHEKLAQEEKKKAEQVAADEQKRSDRALTARYRTEVDIALARKRDSEIVNEQIIQQKKALSVADKDWKEVQGAVESQKKKGVVPAGMQYKLDRAEQNVHDLKARVSDSEAELAQVHAKYDTTLQRYREISQNASSR